MQTRKRSDYDGQGNTSTRDKQYQWDKAIRGEFDLLKVRLASLRASKTWDPASMLDGGTQTTTISVVGAKLGDFAFPSFSLSLQGIISTAYVSADNVVTVVLQNETGGTINLASGTLRVVVVSLANASLFGLVGQATWDPGSLADAAGESKTVTVTGAAFGDYVAAISLGVDQAGAVITGAVSAADTVVCRLQNETGAGSFDLATSTVSVFVIPASIVFGWALQGYGTWDPASLLDGAGESKVIAVSGAEMGDFAFFAFPITVSAMLQSAHVSTPGFVTCRLQNETTGTLNLAPTTPTKVLVLKKDAFFASFNDKFSLLNNVAGQ